MNKFLTFLAKKLWPDFETLAEPDRVSLLGQLFGTLYSLPLAIVLQLRREQSGSDYCGIRYAAVWPNGCVAACPEYVNLLWS
jgi:hypothetical protein